jgi:exonuclease VII small subunit
MHDNDPEEIDEMPQQLSTKVREMEEGAMDVDDAQFLQDNERLQEAEKSLRKLARKKRELQNNGLGASPQFKAVPPAAGIQLTDNTVADLFSVLARGQSKLPTPSWPKFNDS